MKVLTTTTLLICVVFSIGADVSSERIRHRAHRRNRPPCNNGKPSVKLRNGATILGTVNRTVDEGVLYYAYRGIPYAEPPVGNLRFRPPVPLRGKFFNKVINATEFATPCLQPLTLAQNPEIDGTEDCLFLNVFVPQINSCSQLPVMFWIYGGYFLVGSSNLYGPDYFLNDNVIIVSPNYRLGVFGFLNTEDHASPGNYGLKDLIVALHWVQDNIEAFGGNKSSVTIFGESAGAVSLTYLAQSPLTRGLFHKSITESGSNLCMWGTARHNIDMAFAIGRFLGIHTNNSEYLVEELRKEPEAKLVAASLYNDVANLIFSNVLYTLPYAPTMEPEGPGAVVTRPMHQAYTEGHYTKIPKIIGFNSREGSPFVEVIILFFKWYLLRYETRPYELVPASLNVRDPPTVDEIASLLKKYYWKDVPIILSNESTVQFVTDDLFSRPILEEIALVSGHNNVYFYNFSFESPLGNSLRVGPGVGHGEELYYLWRMKDEPKHLTKYELLTRRRLVRMWTNFAKTANPTPIRDPLLQEVIWPKINASANQINVLNIGKNLVAMPYENPGYIYWKGIFKEFGRPPYSTY